MELQATQSERLLRNESEFRLSRKASKRNVAESRARLLQADRDHVLNTEGDFHYPERYLKIDNTKLPASDVARRIVETFDLNEREPSALHDDP